MPSLRNAAILLVPLFCACSSKQPLSSMPLDETRKVNANVTASNEATTHDAMQRRQSASGWQLFDSGSFVIPIHLEELQSLNEGRWKQKEKSATVDGHIVWRDLRDNPKAADLVRSIAGPIGLIVDTKAMADDELLKALQVTSITSEIGMTIVGPNCFSDPCRAEKAAAFTNLSTLTRLQALDIRTEFPSANDYAFIQEFSELKYLGYDRVEGINEKLRYIHSLAELTSLSLSGTEITGVGAVYIAKLKKLELLSLADTEITDAELMYLKDLANLRFLQLEDTKVTDTGLAYIAGLSNLELLVLKGTSVTDAGVAHIAGFTNLKFLDLSATNVTDASLVHIAKLTNLKFLNLRSTHISATALAKIRETILYLSY